MSTAFKVTDEQAAIREGVRAIVSQFGLSYWKQKDERHEFGTEFWSALGQAGYLGTAIPEEYGGAGLGMTELAIVCEEACASGGGSTNSQLFMLTPVFGGISVLRHGNEEQKRRYLPEIAAGRLDFCMALTEPNAGTDTLAIETFARKDGDGYVVNGQKIWISGVDRAGCMLLVARTTPKDQAPRGGGLSLFLVDLPNPGVDYTPLDKVGTHTVTSSAVYFNDLRLPASALLGAEGSGWKYVLDTLNCERMVTSAGCIATADIALGLASKYARERHIFGRPIGANQGLSFPLAKIKIQVEMARLMNQKAAWLFDQGQPCGTEANMAKYAAAEAAFDACDQAMQTHGGMGYSVDFHVERLWRDVRLFRLAPVTQEMILNFVAQKCLDLPRSY